MHQHIILSFTWLINPRFCFFKLGAVLFLQEFKSPPAVVSTHKAKCFLQVASHKVVHSSVWNNIVFQIVRLTHYFNNQWGEVNSSTVLKTTLRYFYWSIFILCYTLYFNSTTFQKEILYFLLNYIYLKALLVNLR